MNYITGNTKANFEKMNTLRRSGTPQKNTTHLRGWYPFERRRAPLAGLSPLAAGPAAGPRLRL